MTQIVEINEKYFEAKFLYHSKLHSAIVIFPSIWSDELLNEQFQVKQEYPISEYSSHKDSFGAIVNVMTEMSKTIDKYVKENIASQSTMSFEDYESIYKAKYAKLIQRLKRLNIKNDVASELVKEIKKEFELLTSMKS